MIIYKGRISAIQQHNHLRSVWERSSKSAFDSIEHFNITRVTLDGTILFFQDGADVVLFGRNLS